jgi:hypothetical protein
VSFVCLTPLSLIFPNTCLHPLCLVLFLLGYGWKSLDFDTLETIESGLNVATPGSKYQYYRAVFLDYKDNILEQKQVQETLTNVTDEIRQQALNLLEHHASWGEHKITKGMDV